MVLCLLFLPATPEVTCYMCPLCLSVRMLRAGSREGGLSGERAVCQVASLVWRTSWLPVSALNICWVNTQAAIFISSNKYVVPEADIRQIFIVPLYTDWFALRQPLTELPQWRSVGCFFSAARCGVRTESVYWKDVSGSQHCPAV